MPPREISASNLKLISACRLKATRKPPHLQHFPKFQKPSKIFPHIISLITSYSFTYIKSYKIMKKLITIIIISLTFLSCNDTVQSVIVVQNNDTTYFRGSIYHGSSGLYLCDSLDNLKNIYVFHGDYKLIYKQ